MAVQLEAHNFHEVDVIGDVHGCFEELIELVEKLGYVKSESGLYIHPDERLLAFVGDLTDRGPENFKCLSFALEHVNRGYAVWCQGNHDNKLYRWLKGNPVKVGNGLASTVSELEHLPETEKLRLSKLIENLPLYVDLDDGKLRICHAAAPPKNAGRGKTKSVLLYGHTTGKRNEEGFPERLNWVPAYNQTATEDTPYVVYGHVTHAEPYVTEHACCIDTACFTGNKLSAFRWPEREVVSVPSRQKWDGTRQLVLHDKKSKKTPVKRAIDPVPIDDMSLPHLLGQLRDNEEDVLYLIDTDDMLNKREHDNGLLIANASKGLFEPEYEHQFYSKGIVYQTDPYRLVSLPLVKMHNHGRREFSDKVSRRYENESGVRFVYPEKMDGTMIQLFEHEGETYFTTRSVLEGTGADLEEGDFPFIGEARRIASEKYPQLLNPEFLKGKTLVFELIHPDNRIVTNYGDREALVLLSVFDLNTFEYWTNDDVIEFAVQNGLDRFEILIESDDFQKGVDKIIAKLEDADNLPEGSIVCFEKDGQIVHRVKVKTQEYLKYHRLKFQCTLKSVVEMLWNQPELHDWDAFNEYLQDNLLTEEEVEQFYREHFDTFMEWYRECKQLRAKAKAVVETFNEGYEGDPEANKGAYYKALAIHSNEHHNDVFSYVMSFARDGEIPLIDVMWRNEPCNGFKGIVSKWREDQEE